MEELRSSRRPAKSSYADIFGGAPKSSASFAARSDDYAEIFGGIAATSCSIPFLYLPPSIEGCDTGLFDYSEIFGGFNAGDFAVDYKELFSKEERKGTAEISSASSNGSIGMDANFGQTVGASDLCPEGASEDYGSCSEKNKLSSSSNDSDDGSKQFSMSYHRTSRGSIEDVISGKTHITQLHAVPGYTFMDNSGASKDFIHNASSNGRLNDAEQEKTLASSVDKIKSNGADIKTIENEFNSKHAAPEVDPGHMKHHSCSSSNYSVSSGDIPCPDVTYVGISDINLRTKPSRMPPPSRAPPKIISKQENTKTNMYRSSKGDQEKESSMKSSWSQKIHYRIGDSKSHGLQGVANDSSSSFLDVEIDASSALAASAAAMKEAMEQAQARLKSAKELMERKQDNLPGRKKRSNKDSAKFDERKEVKTFDKGKNFSEATTKKPLLKEDKETNEFAIDNMQEATKAGKVAPDHEEKERSLTSEDGQQTRLGNALNSSQMRYTSEEVSGEWKTEKQFYELINNGRRFGAVKEPFKLENVEKKLKPDTKINDNVVNYSELTEIAYECNGAENLDKDNKTIDRDETIDNPEACNVIHKAKIRKGEDKTSDTFMLKEHKLVDSLDSHHEVQAAQETLVNGEELKKPNAAQGVPCGEYKINMESNNASILKRVYHDDDENRKVRTAKEACEHADNKDFSEPYVSSVSYESEKLKMFSGTCLQHENKNDIEVDSEIPVREAVEELVAPEEVQLESCHKESEYLRGNGKLESCHEESAYKIKSTSSVSEHEESAASGAQASCMPVENDVKSEVAQDSNEVKENSEELKPAPCTIGHGVTEEKMNLAEEPCWPDYNEMETRETKHEVHKNGKKQDAEQSPTAVKNTLETEVLRGDHSETKDVMFKEGNRPLGSDDTPSNIDTPQEIQHRLEKNDSRDAQQGSRPENKNMEAAAQEVYQKSRSSSPDTKETAETVVTEKFNPDVLKRETLDCERTMEKEREHEKEQARKAEEEKEREREREKDRLAVERATREAHERAARERAERIAVERVTAEARQRALTESREKAEKAAAEALEKSLAEKALKEAKLRAERAAVERALAEARERAVEKLLADKAAADSRQRTERLNTVSRDKIRKDNEAGEYFRASDKDDIEIKLKASSSDVLHDERFQNAGPSGSSQRYTEFSAHGEVESPLRCKARLERHQRTVERAAKALAEKNMRDILAQREQAERNRLAESLDADVRRWSTGKEGNLRALLSTLQYILGPESGWQPIPLTDVITAAAVKKAYRKATLYVHPDKLQQRGASIQQKYICEKVFDLLKEAWNRFNSGDDR